MTRAHADSSRLPIGREEHDGRRQDIGQQQCEFFHRAIRGQRAGGWSKRDVVVSAKPDQSHVATVPLLPDIELAPQEQNALPERAAGARRATALELDHRRRELDHACVEVHGAAGRQVIGASGSMQERAADDAPWRAENILRPHRHAVDDDDELRLDADRRQG